MQVCLAWGAWKEEQVGCQTPFGFFRLHQSIVSVCLGGWGPTEFSFHPKQWKSGHLSGSSVTGDLPGISCGVEAP